MFKLGEKIMTKFGKELRATSDNGQWKGYKRKKNPCSYVEVYFLQKLFGLHKDSKDGNNQGTADIQKSVYSTTYGFH
jgi:hypothetical protein